MDPPTAVSPSNREKISVWVFWLGSGVVFALSLIWNYWFLLFLASTLFFYIPIIVFHELGHAVAAVMLGGKTHYIALGRYSARKTPWKVKFLGFIWYVYSTPLYGYVHFSFYSIRYYRLRRCLAIAAGPSVNFLLIVIAGLLVWSIGPYVEYVDQPGPYIPILTVWILLNAYVCFSTVWPPGWTLRASYENNNDICLIWKTLFYTDEQIKNFVSDSVLKQSYAIQSIKLKPLTLLELFALPESEKSSPGAACYVVYRALKEKHSQGSELLLHFVQRTDIPTTYAQQITDTYLTSQLTEGLSGMPAVIDKLSQKLLEWKNCPSTRGTRGSILVDLGRLEEGKTMLHEVLENTTHAIDKTYSHIFLALAAKQEGNLELAREHAEKAAKIDPMCAALKRVSDLLPTKPEDGKEQKVGGPSASSG